jgi:hypothetical protein
MPMEVPVEHQQQIPRQLETHVAVRDMRTVMGDTLTLRRLARSAGLSAATLCMWERGLCGMRPRQQRVVLQTVRREFALFCVRVAQVAERNGVRPGAS